MMVGAVRIHAYRQARASHVCLIHCMEQSLGRISQFMSVLRSPFSASQIKAPISAPRSSQMSTADDSVARLVIVPAEVEGPCRRRHNSVSGLKIATWLYRRTRDAR